MTAGAKRRGLLVDRLIGHQDIVVKGLDPALGRPDRRFGHHHPGRRQGRLHPRRGPHSGRSRHMSTDARAVAEPLLGFADSLPAPAADTAAPAAMLHLLTFTLDREEFGIPVDPGARGDPGGRDHPGAPGAGARPGRDQPARPDPRGGGDPHPARPDAGGGHPVVPHRGGRGDGPRAGAAGGPRVAGDQGAGGQRGAAAGGGASPRRPTSSPAWRAGTPGSSCCWIWRRCCS